MKRRGPVLEVVGAAAVLLVVAGLAHLAGWDGPRKWSTSTAVWPFYLDTYDRSIVLTWRALWPVAALALAWLPLRQWASDDARRAGLPMLVALVAAAWVYHLGVGFVRHGVEQGLTRTFYRTGLEYWGDIHFLFDDARHFLARFPDELGGTLSQHGASHPPGLTVLLWALTRIGARSSFAAELCCSTFGALSALPLYGAARRLADEDVARFAVPLLLFACSVVAFSVLAMDVVTMFFAALALYGFARALDGDGVGGILWGLAQAAATLCTFTMFMLSLTWAVLLIARRHQLDRRRLAALALGPAAFLAFYAVLHFGFGYRPVVVLVSSMKSFAASDDSKRSLLRGVLGNPLAFLGSLGLPILGLAAHSIGGAVQRLRERTDLPTVALLLGAALPPAVCIALGKPRGEVEHVFLPFVPALMLGVAAAARRWYQRSFDWLCRFAVPALVAQSILLEVFFETFW
jgi:hypothetical protein